MNAGDMMMNFEFNQEDIKDALMLESIEIMFADKNEGGLNTG